MWLRLKGAPALLQKSWCCFVPCEAFFCKMAVAQETGTKMGCPGKWKHGPKHLQTGPSDRFFFFFNHPQIQKRFKGVRSETHRLPAPTPRVFRTARLRDEISRTETAERPARSQESLCEHRSLGDLSLFRLVSNQRAGVCF